MAPGVERRSYFLFLQVNLAGIGVSVIEASVTKLAREVMHVAFTGVSPRPHRCRLTAQSRQRQPHCTQSIALFGAVAGAPQHRSRVRNAAVSLHGL